jgi:hypothetical protein
VEVIPPADTYPYHLMSAWWLFSLRKLWRLRLLLDPQLLGED